MNFWKQVVLMLLGIYIAEEIWRYLKYRAQAKKMKVKPYSFFKWYWIGLKAISVFSKCTSREEMAKVYYKLYYNKEVK